MAILNNYILNLYPPFQSNNEDGSRSAKKSLRLQNLSSQGKGNLTFTITGSASSNMSVNINGYPSLYGSFFNNTPKGINTSFIEESDQKSIEIKYQTRNDQITTSSATATLIVQSEVDTIYFTCSATILAAILGLSSSLSAQFSNGRFDFSDNELFWDQTNSTGVYFTSTLSGLTGTPYVVFPDRFYNSVSNYGLMRGHTVRAIGLQNTGNIPVVLNMNLTTPANIPISIFKISNISSNILTLGNNTFATTLKSQEKAFFRISIDITNIPVQYWQNSEQITAKLEINHNANNVPTPLVVNFYNGLTGQSYNWV